MKKIILGILGGMLLLNSCDIERFPYGSMAAESIENDPENSLEALMNGTYSQLKGWSDVMHRCGEYAGDNIMIRGTSKDAFYEFISYSRTPNNGRLNNFWNSSYKVIAQTSNIIKLIEEGKSEKIDHKLGECYFLRGMMYFYLCRVYGRPYYQSPEKNLGVPIVNGTPDDMENLVLPDRSTVEVTYKQIISDLKKSTELLNENNGPAYVSLDAAYALLSKVYLYMSGTYEKPNTQYAELAVEYATKVIESPNYKLLSRSDFMKYNTILPESNKESIFVIKRLASEFTSGNLHNSIGGLYAKINGSGWGEIYPSAKYLDLLNETGRNDWRKGTEGIVDARAAFIDPQYMSSNTEVFRFIKDLYNDKGEHVNYAYVQAKIERSGSTITCIADDKKKYTLTPVNVQDEEYSITYSDGKTYKGYIDYEMELNRSYPMFYILKCSKEGSETHLHSPIILRLGEIYLNRAEAYAKCNKYSEALGDLNKVRTRSIINGAYSSLDSSNAPDLIDKERQLELAFQAERSFDVYRNGESLERKYPGPHNAMEVIPATDYRVVFYIPQSAINSYPEGSTLTQNPTSN